MTRRFVLPTVAALVLAFPTTAKADVGVYPVTKIVPLGGMIEGWGDGSGMAVYLVPAAAGPKRYGCGPGICEPTVKHAPGKPFVLLGHLRRTKNVYARQSFKFSVPSNLSPGLYRMYLYCRPCGGSLIQSGGRLEGETIRLTARPLSRRIRVGSAPTRVHFLVAEPAGVILLLRVTVPHGTHVRVTGRIPGLAGVAISTDGRSRCRRHGAVDICSQPKEWCPMPAAAWHFDLRKLAGPAGVLKLTFVIGPPPNG